MEPIKRFHSDTAKPKRPLGERTNVPENATVILVYTLPGCPAQILIWSPGENT